MKVSVKRKLVNKKLVKFITLVNKNNFKVTLCDFGAAIYSISYLHEDNEEFLSLTPKSLKDFMYSSQYYGKAIGPVAGRIKEGRFTIEDKEYQIELNSKGCTLHSGTEGFSFKKFKTKVNKSRDYASVVFSIVSNHLENGFPGRVKAQFIYTVNDANDDLDIDFIANTNQTTIINLTSHAYFNLDNNENDILDHHLIINASKVGHMEENLVVDRYVEVPPCLDFQKEKVIKEDLFDSGLIVEPWEGYDHVYALNEHDLNEPQVILKGKRRTMEIFTTYPGLVFYSCNYPSYVKLINCEEEKLFQAVALETQLLSGDVESMILRPNETYHHQTKYRFK